MSHDLMLLKLSCNAWHVALEEALGELVWRISDAKCKKPIHADWCVRGDKKSDTQRDVTRWEKLSKEVCFGEYDEKRCKVMGGAASTCQPHAPNAATNLMPVTSAVTPWTASPSCANKLPTRRVTCTKRPSMPANKRMPPWHALSSAKGTCASNGIKNKMEKQD